MAQYRLGNGEPTRVSIDAARFRVSMAQPPYPALNNVSRLKLRCLPGARSCRIRRHFLCRPLGVRTFWGYRRPESLTGTSVHASSGRWRIAGLGSLL
jgi:hypothetical protein